MHPYGYVPPNGHTSDYRPTCVHEAGHVLLAVHAGLPVWRVWVAYTGGHDTQGRVEVAENNGYVTGTDWQAALFSLGGPAAEARWRHVQGGRSRSWARMETNGGCGDDLAELDSAIRDGRLDRRAVEAEVERVLERGWSRVLALADLIAERGLVDGTTARRVLR